jgi:hypothetical protein
MCCYPVVNIVTFRIRGSCANVGWLWTEACSGKWQKNIAVYKAVCRKSRFSYILQMVLLQFIFPFQLAAVK